MSNSQPAIVIPTLDDVESYRRMQAASWVDTYPNEEAGVPYEWVKAYTETWLTPEALAASRERVKGVLENPNSTLLIAKVGNKSVGMINVTREEGEQELEAIYVDRDYHGTGLSQRLIDAAFATLDLTNPVKVNVVAYNKRAQGFYEKNGFVAIPGSEHLYKEKLPTIDMIREGDTNEV